MAESTNLPTEDEAQLLYKLVFQIQTNHHESVVTNSLGQLANVNQLFPHQRQLHRYPGGIQRTTPLYEASRALSWRKDSFIKLFLNAGANVNMRNENGATALHGAVQTGNKSAVRALLDHGADIDAKIYAAKEQPDGEAQPNGNAQPGWTPLHQAAHCGSEMMVRLLLERGANIFIRDDLGRTPLDVAIARRRQGPFWALLEYGAAEQRDMVREPNKLDKSLLWEADALPDWVFTSASLKRVPESLVAFLERLIVKSSPWKDTGAEPRLCTGCETLKETNPERYKEKDRIISRWRGKASFDTRFRKRCLLCRKVIAGFDVSSTSTLKQASVQGEDETDLTDFLRLSVDRKKDTIASEPVILMYEASDTYSPVGWDLIISEELASLLDHADNLLDLDTASECAFMLAAYWLHNCLTCHRNCVLADEGMPFLPTRVIDVGSPDVNQPPRLHVSEGQRGLYSTLSYRWDPSNFFTTRCHNLEDLQKSIPVESLPPTIQDAITITRNLGVKYLWVDAICIIQDDTNDWNREAARMAGVYRNSLFTIAAVDGPARGRGIFTRRHQIPRPWRRECSPDAIPGWFDYNHPFYTSSQHARSRPPGELDTRGWCLQEQVISPRILSYADGELFWDCASLSASESIPGGISESISRKAGKKFTDVNVREFKSLVLKITHNILTEDSREKIYRLWRTAVETFMDRSLTKETDRLVAIQGISDVVAPFVDDELIIGLWKNSFARHLLWWIDSVRHAHRYASRPSTFKAASWSWASVVGNIHYGDIYQYRYAEDDKKVLGTVGGPFAPAITVKDIHIKTDTANMEAAGKLIVEGSLIKVFTRENEGGKCVFYSGYPYLHYPGRRIFLSPGPTPPHRRLVVRRMAALKLLKRRTLLRMSLLNTPTGCIRYELSRTGAPTAGSPGMRTRKTTCPPRCTVCSLRWRRIVSFACACGRRGALRTSIGESVFVVGILGTRMLAVMGSGPFRQ